MSRHEGVSCDSCMKANFRGRRYKCLTCYDYDLCAACYEAGTTTTRHNADHAMQCILTRTDFDLFYGGEALTVEQPQAFCCPYCGKMGYTEITLQEHVTSDHTEASNEVVCPICAALPGGDPNHVTDDFTAHLTLEHRAPRDFQDEPLGGIRHVRRIQHPGRGVAGSRARRTFNFQSTAGLSNLTPASTRDTPMDPIAELLSQLSSVRSRAAAAQSVSSQLQQLEMQLQSTRQQLERLPRQRGTDTIAKAAAAAPQPATILDFAGAVNSNPVATGNSGSNAYSQYLLSRLGDTDLSEMEQQNVETDRADRSLFVQELLLSTLAEGLRLETTPSSSPPPEAAASPVNTPSQTAPASQDPPTSPPRPACSSGHAENSSEHAASVAPAPSLRGATAEQGALSGRLPPRPKPAPMAHRKDAMVKHKAESVRNSSSEKELAPPHRVPSKH